MFSKQKTSQGISCTLETKTCETYWVFSQRYFPAGGKSNQWFMIAHHVWHITMNGRKKGTVCRYKTFRNIMTFIETFQTIRWFSRGINNLIRCQEKGNRDCKTLWLWITIGFYPQTQNRTLVTLHEVGFNFEKDAKSWFKQNSSARNLALAHQPNECYSLFKQTW